MRPILKSPRILRTGQPLGLEGIRQVCPAVFAPGPHESRGPRYAYVPTIEPLTALLDNGWGVYEASQQRSRAADRDPYTKHMLRLRRLDCFEMKQSDGVAEVILINAHDGTAAYQIKAGYFRFVCSNGIIAGNTMAGIKVVHSIGRQTSDEVLGAAHHMVTERFPLLLAAVQRFQGIELDTAHQYRLAQKALDLRYPNVLPRFDVAATLHARREEDRQPTLWNILNRVQENVIYGGWEGESMGGRRSAVRPVERVSAVTAINGGIWDEAFAIAEELS
jgi:hypothetical protein